MLELVCTLLGVTPWAPGTPGVEGDTHGCGGRPTQVR